MNRNFVMAIVCFLAPLAPMQAAACAGHLYLNPDDFGFIGGAVVRMAGLAPPEPVFDLEYPTMTKAVIGDESAIAVSFSRPFFSDNVSLKIKGTKNVQLLQDEFILEDRSGIINIPYELTGSGYDTITLTVSGEHKGEIVSESGRIYIRAASKPKTEELQVSGR